MSAKPKRILFLSPTAGMGGAEVVLLSIAQNINKKKFSCVLVTQEEGALTRAFRMTGAWASILSMPAWRKFKNYFRRHQAVRRLYAFVKEQKIDIIHCNNYRLTPYAVKVARACHIPCVTHIHDFLKDKHIKRFALPKATAILTVSDYVSRPFAKYKVPVRRIYNGIDEAAFNQGDKDFRRELGLFSPVWLIGIVANFTENKRHSLFLSIAGKIKNQIPDVRFVIVGHNAWDTQMSQERLIQMAEDKGLDQYVIFTGWRTDVPHILCSLDALVVPSKTESFPLVVLEAMASGVVVFAQKTAGGPAEQITDGVDGFLVDCEDINTTANKIVGVLSNQELCEKMGQSARARILEKFTLQGFIHEMEDFYTMLLENKK